MSLLMELKGVVNITDDILLVHGMKQKEHDVQAIDFLKRVIPQQWLI